MPESKSEVRKRILSARGALTEAEVISRSVAVRDRLVSSDAFKSANMIMCYMDFRNEVRTGDIINAAFASGKRVALPLVYRCGSERKLVAYEINNLCEDVEPGIWGILEPCSRKLRQVQETEIDLVIVPGVGFDVNRQRLGYGAGYYDNFIVKLRPDCRKIAVAFDVQIQESIPVEAHDMKMDAIITETRVI